jgi:hypothetical protein
VDESRGGIGVGSARVPLQSEGHQYREVEKLPPPTADPDDVLAVVASFARMAALLSPLIQIARSGAVTRAASVFAVPWGTAKTTEGTHPCSGEVRAERAP